MKKQNIILVGYMGCGKSTVGKNLARVCGYSFFDTDCYIEDNQGTSITEIFASKGEASFRDMETECIRDMIDKNFECNVISTGGGMAVRAENRELLKQLGTVVYLRVKPETVYNRIKGDTTRPLLQCENPLEKIKEMLGKRSEYYEEAADLIIDVDDMKQAEISKEIKNMIAQGV